MSKFNINLNASFCYLPSKIITNKMLVDEIYCPSLDEKKTRADLLSTMHKYTGITERRYSLDSEASSDLAIQAVKPLLSAHPELKDKITALLVATTSGDHPSPATANWVHHGLQLNPNVQSLDVASSCTSFLSGFRASLGFIATGCSTLVVATEAKHKNLCKGDIRTLSLFSDGAAGFYLDSTALPNACFDFAYQQIQSELADNICIPTGGSRKPFSGTCEDEIYLRFLEPKKMFLHTVKNIVQCILSLEKTLLEKYSSNRINLIYIHQANKNILEEVKRQLPSHLSSKIPSLMSDVGNMVCASFPVLRSRIRFLYSLMCTYGKRFEFSELSDVCLHVAKIDPRFSIFKYENGLVFHHKLNSEESYIFDGASSEIEGSWFTRISESEFLDLIQYIDNIGFIEDLEPIDFWIGAGGGFQTLGVIHFAQVEKF